MKKLIFVVGCMFLLSLSLNAAKITRITGKPEVLKSLGDKWEIAKVGMKLSSQDKIRCGRGCRVKLLMDNGHKITIWPHSKITLDQIDKGETKVSLFLGRIRSFVKKLKKNQKFQIQTPVAVCSVRGTDFSVAIDDAKKVVVEVYEGQVAAKEGSTGAEVVLYAGEYTAIEANKAPQLPEKIPEKMDEQTLTPEEAIKEEFKQEVFDEISREDVLARAAEEIKLAEYQNGKAMIDAYGKRVRLEEYIVRPEPNSFKYVVLNSRENRFDFGKIIFTFNSTLPDDLTLVTKNMFYYEGITAPEIWLTDVVSVMSNTVDQVNEEASGGQMYADNIYNPKSYTLGFSNYTFSVNSQKWWEFNDINQNGTLDSGEISYYNISTGSELTSTNGLISELTQPSGSEAFHFYQKNTYTDGQWIAVEDYIINDDGEIITLSDLRNLTSTELEQKAYESNFERVYTCSVFEGRKIDLVFSAKLLIDAGILNLPNPRNISE